jgi:hypothetical protein
MMGEHVPKTQKPLQSESLVHGFGAQAIAAPHWKFAVQSVLLLQAAASQRLVELHTMLGPQSAALPQPLVQCFCGCAPPCEHPHGRSQMSPVPASAQSASVMQLPMKLLSHWPLQKGGRMSTPQKFPGGQSLCDRQSPDGSPPVPMPLELELVLVLVCVLVLVLVVDVVPDPPWPPEDAEDVCPEVVPFEPVEPAVDPHAAAAATERHVMRSLEGGKRMPLSYPSTVPLATRTVGWSCRYLRIRGGTVGARRRDRGARRGYLGARAG